MKNVIRFTTMLMSFVFIVSTVSFSQSYWQKGTISSSTATINELAINSSGHIFAATNGNGIWKSTDDGATWTRIGGAGMQSHYYTLIIDKNDIIYAGSYLGSGYKSNDNGATWQQFTLGHGNSIVTSYAIDKNGKIYCGTGGEGVFTSTDNGGTWDTLEGAPFYPYITSLFIDSRQNVFAGTYGGGLYESTDGGIGWSQAGSEYWRANALTAGANDRIITGTDFGLYYDSLAFVPKYDSTGTTILRTDTVRSGWVDVAFHLDHIDTITTIKKLIDTLITEPVTYDTTYDTTVTYDSTFYHNQWYVTSMVSTPGGHILAATIGNGVMRSTDNGTTWKDSTTGLLENSITALAINKNTGFVYAGTSFGGFYKSKNAEPIVGPMQNIQSSLRPILATIEQNYPNPFNPTTNIPFTLHENSYTTLVIYDILGKEVTRLVDGMVVAGTHVAKWDASTAASGVYFYRFQTQSVVKTGKLTLLK